MAPMKREGAKMPPEPPEPSVKSVASILIKISRKAPPMANWLVSAAEIGSYPPPNTWGMFS